MNEEVKHDDEARLKHEKQQIDQVKNMLASFDKVARYGTNTMIDEINVQQNLTCEAQGNSEIVIKIKYAYKGMYD